VVLKLEVDDHYGIEELSECGAYDCPWYNMTTVAHRPSDNMVFVNQIFFTVWYFSHISFYSELSILVA